MTGLLSQRRLSSAPPRVPVSLPSFSPSSLLSSFPPVSLFPLLSRVLVSRNVGKGPAVQPRDQATRWENYLQGVRNARRGQWGDEATLVALSGVTGRPIITVTGRANEVPRVEERTPPEGWEMSAITGAPIVLTHEMDNHYTPVRFQDDGFWSWIPAWESAAREGNDGGEEELERGLGDARELEGRNGRSQEVELTGVAMNDDALGLAVQVRNHSLSLRPAAVVNGASEMELDLPGQVASWSAIGAMQDRSFLVSLRPVAEELIMEVDDQEPELTGGG